MILINAVNNIPENLLILCYTNKERVWIQIIKIMICLIKSFYFKYRAIIVFTSKRTTVQ